MSNIGMKYQLEARVNIAGESSSYSICGCWIERMPGSTETYIAGSHSWVCAECANGIDQELALFAYRPEVLPRRRPEERHPEYFDNGCPFRARALRTWEKLISRLNRFVSWRRPALKDDPPF